MKRLDAFDLLDEVLYRLSSLKKCRALDMLSILANPRTVKLVDRVVSPRMLFKLLWALGQVKDKDDVEERRQFVKRQPKLDADITEEILQWPWIPDYIRFGNGFKSMVFGFLDVVEAVKQSLGSMCLPISMGVHRRLDEHNWPPPHKHFFSKSKVDVLNTFPRE